MNRFRLTVITILLLPVIFLGWLTLTENGLNWAYRQAEFYLPPELSFNKLEGKLIGPITLKGLEYHHDNVTVSAQQVRLDWLATALLAANININELHIQSLNIVIEDARNGETATRNKIELPEIHLPWRLLLHNVEINTLTVTQHAQSYRLNRVELDATTLFSKINFKQLALHGEGFDLAIKGKLRPVQAYDHNLEINWQYTLPDGEVLKGQGQLSGSLQKTRLQQNTSGPLQLILDASLNDITDRLMWTASANIRHFDLDKLLTGRLDSNWLALTGAGQLNASGDLSTAELTGSIQGHYPELGKLDADFDLHRQVGNTIQINHLKLQAPKQNTLLEADGQWTPGERGGDVKLALNWQNLRWPVQDAPWFDSARGNGTITGNIDNYKLTLDTDSPWPLTAPSIWHASATGNLAGMKVSNIRINALNGEANVSGQLDWTKQFNWQAEGKFNNIDPSARWSQWPGKLNGELASRGHVENGSITGDTDIRQIKGKLRSYPVSLQDGRLSWQQDHLDISGLDYRSGNSRVSLSGSYGDSLDLDWKLDSQHLSELYPGAHGQLQATGRLTGRNDAPLVEASFDGKSLSYPGFDIAGITGEMTVELFRWHRLDIQLAASDLTLGSTQLLSLAIHSDDQLFTSDIVSAKAKARIELKGRADATGWQGHIEKADVDSDYFDSWQLDRPVPMSVTEKKLRLENICWHSNLQASLCAAVEQQQSAWLANIRMHRTPLTLFERWLPQSLKLKGTAEATAKIEYQLPDTLLADLEIALPAGTINYPMLSGENDHREYRSGKLQLSLNSEGFKASSEMTMSNGDSLSGRINLPGYQLLSTTDPAQPLTATARVQASDLRIIEAFVPEIYGMQGELKAHFAATGTLNKPLISGDAKMVNGALQIPGLGLDIKQVTMTSHSAAAREFRFQLDAHSGDGSLKITGHTRLDRSAGWPTEIVITGKDFEAAQIPEAMVTISPELTIKIVNRSIDISGSVHVPYAHLQPKDVTRAASVSSDAIIISDTQANEEKWQITSSVRVTLGERVHFYGFGFEGRLGGSLLLEDEPGQLTKATGEITIPEGNYRAYGQRLEVENGRILYTGSPLTNPGVDIRAIRKVDNVTAGIHVKGSLNQLRLEIFSSPAMSQTDALAYLLLGGPIENASNEDGAMLAKAALALGLSGGDTIARSLADRFGLDEMRIESRNKGDQAALVVGRYLSPRIYVSYGVGLIERVNTITLRYQVSNKWQVKIESGEYQGADILYTIER